MHNIARKITILLFLTHCFLYQASAGQANKIAPAQWHHLKDDKALNYKNDREQPVLSPKYKPGLFEKAILSFLRFFAGGIGQLLLWLIVISAVIYVIYSLAIRRGSYFFGKRSKVMAAAGPPEAETEDITNTNWELLLAAATGNGDTRLAVRYSYMWLLQLLQQRELIRYRTDKTNYEYYTELNETSYKDTFRQLSRQYEYAWYGHFAPSAEAYSEYATLFTNLKNQLGK